MTCLICHWFTYEILIIGSFVSNLIMSFKSRSFTYYDIGTLNFHIIKIRLINLSNISTKAKEMYENVGNVRIYLSTNLLPVTFRKVLNILNFVWTIELFNIVDIASQRERPIYSSIFIWYKIADYWPN